MPYKDLVHKKLKNKIVIAGPCSLESREGLRTCVQGLLDTGVRIIRASLWKPRTVPGWEGLGVEGVNILLEETLPYGLIPATEIVTAEHAHIMVDALDKWGKNYSMVLWLGSRNQNHFEIKKIVKTLRKGHDNVFLLFKNQMWHDERHWIGIYKHLIDAGFPKERLLTCHRGFAGKSPEGYRNPPDFEMALRIKEELQIPMLLDPSHIGGEKPKVFNIMRFPETLTFDGYQIEVHSKPNDAKTDAGQQLTIQEFKELMKELEVGTQHTTHREKVKR